MSQDQVVKILKALANENRLRILDAIRNYQVHTNCCPEGLESPNAKVGSGCCADEVCCVDEIGKQFEMAQSTVSQHLKELHNAGLLERHKKAKWVYYTINPNVMGELVQYLSRFVFEVARTA